MHISRLYKATLGKLQTPELVNPLSHIMGYHPKAENLKPITPEP